MELQIGLALVDQVNGGKETKQRMDGWAGREPVVARRVRAVAAKALVVLAARLSPELAVSPEPRQAATGVSA